MWGTLSQEMCQLWYQQWKTGVHGQLDLLKNDRIWTQIENYPHCTMLFWHGVEGENFEVVSISMILMTLEARWPRLLKWNHIPRGYLQVSLQHNNWNDNLLYRTRFMQKFSPLAFIVNVSSKINCHQRDNQSLCLSNEAKSTWCSKSKRQASSSLFDAFEEYFRIVS